MPMVQVGVMALRSPDGQFLPSTPIYKEVPQVNERGNTPTGEKALVDVSKLFADKFKQYKNGVKRYEASAGND